MIQKPLGGGSPSVGSYFKKGKYSNYLENFKQDCDDISESQNGYHSTETLPNGSYRTSFYTTDDEYDNLFDATLTGTVDFVVEIMNEKEIIEFMDN